MNKWCEKEIAEVIREIARRDKPEEVCELLDVIFTPREINDIARRYKAMIMLNQGKSYLEIRDLLGLSNVVISRVSGKIGLGFRRTHSTTQKRSASHDVSSKKKPIRKYKGSVPIHRIIFG